MEDCSEKQHLSFVSRFFECQGTANSTSRMISAFHIKNTRTRKIICIHQKGGRDRNCPSMREISVRQLCLPTHLWVIYQDDTEDVSLMVKDIIDYSGHGQFEMISIGGMMTPYDGGKRVAITGPIAERLDMKVMSMDPRTIMLTWIGSRI